MSCDDHHVLHMWTRDFPSTVLSYVTGNITNLLVRLLVGHLDILVVV